VDSQKRRHGRVRTTQVSTQVQAHGRVRTGCIVENLSAGGAFIRTAEPSSPGSKIVLELAVPGWRNNLRLAAKVTSVVRANEAGQRRLPPGMGVSFEPYPAPIAAELRSLLLHLAPAAGVLEGDPAEVPAVPVQPGHRPLPARAAALSGHQPLEGLSGEQDEPIPLVLPKRAVHFLATPAQTSREAQLEATLVRQQAELAASQARQRELEEENRSLREQLARTRTGSSSRPR
jgi:hypothetical protein